MNILIVGSGGREHALALAISRSPRLRSLYAAPGNPGFESLAVCVDLEATRHEDLVAFCREKAIDLVVVGPEAPLVAGLVDNLNVAGVACFGPTAAAARLEGSKGYMKDFCHEFGIPTARYRRFTAPECAIDFARKLGAPVVVKADGLAAGKGVIVAETLAEAELAIHNMFAGAFGSAGSEIVIEEFLFGDEVSFFAIADGRRAVGFGSAQDHKRIGDGDKGPNTGGMGAYSPVALMTEAMQARIMRDVIQPTIDGMRARGAPFKGLLFAGLMIGGEGPKLIEFNVRFGDPEAQAILARLDDDLLDYLYGAATGRLPAEQPNFAPSSAIAVILAAKGYPDAPEKGAPILGLENASAVEGVGIVHAGTARVAEALVASGGRVLAVVARGKSILDARERAYDAISRIDMPGGVYRRDIGARGGAS